MKFQVWNIFKYKFDLNGTILKDVFKKQVPFASISNRKFNKSR